MLALLTYFFAGAFLVNGVPHFVQGVSGRGFPSPFANPPGQGESSAQTNVLWGAFNFVVGYALAWRVGHFDAAQAWQLAAISAGRSEEHTSELQSLMRISYAVFCLKKKTRHRYDYETISDTIII